jgi:hypothetical protein
MDVGGARVGQDLEAGSVRGARDEHAAGGRRDGKRDEASEELAEEDSEERQEQLRLQQQEQEVQEEEQQQQQKRTLRSAKLGSSRAQLQRPRVSTQLSVVSGGPEDAVPVRAAGSSSSSGFARRAAAPSLPARPGARTSRHGSARLSVVSSIVSSVVGGETDPLAAKARYSSRAKEDAAQCARNSVRKSTAAGAAHDAELAAAAAAAAAAAPGAGPPIECYCGPSPAWEQLRARCDRSFAFAWDRRFVYGQANQSLFYAAIVLWLWSIIGFVALVVLKKANLVLPGAVAVAATAAFAALALIVSRYLAARRWAQWELVASSDTLLFKAVLLGWLRYHAHYYSVRLRNVREICLESVQVAGTQCFDVEVRCMAADGATAMVMLYSLSAQGKEDLLQLWEASLPKTSHFSVVREDDRKERRSVAIEKML